MLNYLSYIPLGLFSGDINVYYVVGAVLSLIVGSIVGVLSSIVISYIDRNREPGGVVGLISGISLVIPQISISLLLLGKITSFSVGSLILFGIIGLIVGGVIAARR
jgi:hypothetical protein